MVRGRKPTTTAESLPAKLDSYEGIEKMHYLYLAIAIITEVIGTSALKATEEFTKFWPSIIVLVGYLTSFYFLTLCLRHIPVGIAYALWSGVGIILIATVGWLLYKQSLDMPGVIGIGFIIVGVVVINAFSKAARL
jgi:small multidrug resistance pump